MDCRQNVLEIFNGDPSFDADRHVAIATRHGWVDGKYKLSFHVFVKGYRIQECGFGGERFFDLSIYPKTSLGQQLFTVIGGRKRLSSVNRVSSRSRSI